MPGVTPVIGDPLDSTTYASALRPEHVVVHLVDTPKPAPWKGESFRRVDLGSVQQLDAAAPLVVSDAPCARPGSVRRVVRRTAPRAE